MIPQQKASGMVSMASRSRMSAAAVRSTQGLLLSDIDPDADQMQAGPRRAGVPVRSAPAARPFAAGVVHSEVMVDGVGLGVGELGCDLESLMSSDERAG